MKQEYSRTTKTESELEYDSITGEVTKNASKSTTITYEKEPEYIKLYIRDIAKLSDVPAGMDKILIALVSKMGYSNIIPAYKPVKQVIANELGISIDYVNKAITQFHKKGLLIRGARGMYVANPELFGKGKWENVKNLRLTVEYSSETMKNGGKKLSAEITQQLEIGFSSTDD